MRKEPELIDILRIAEAFQSLRSLREEEDGLDIHGVLEMRFASYSADDQRVTVMFSPLTFFSFFNFENHELKVQKLNKKYMVSYEYGSILFFSYVSLDLLMQQPGFDREDFILD